MSTSVDFKEFNLARAVWTELLAEPVVAEGIVFGAGSHASWFELGKGKGAGVVLVDACVDVGRVGRREAESGGDLLKDINDGKEVLAGRAEGDVFSLHGREGDEAVKTAAPLDGAVGKGDDIAGAAAGAMGIVGPLVPPEASEVGVGVAVEAVGIIGVKDEAFVGGPIEVLGDALEGSFVGLFGAERVASTLVDGERNVGTGVAGDVEEHADDAGVVDEAGGRLTVGVFWKGSGFSRSFDGGGKSLVDSASVNDLFDEAWLG